MKTKTTCYNYFLQGGIKRFQGQVVIKTVLGSFSPLKTHRKTSDHVIWSYCNNNRLHTEIWHQGRNEGPSTSCVGKRQFKNNCGGWRVADEVLSLTAFNDFGNCYQKYDREEIEGKWRHSCTHRRHSDPIPPLSLPLEAENWQSHSDPPCRVCALHTTAKQNESATKPTSTGSM